MNAPPTIAQQSMACEKCHVGVMVAMKVFRLSGCLVTLGFILLVPAILGLILATCFGVLVGGVAGSAGLEVQASAKSNALVRFQAIQGMPTNFLSDFSRTPEIAISQISTLPVPVQNDASNVAMRFKIDEGAGSLGVAAGGLFGGAFVIGLFVVSIPTLIVGFLLILRKKVWRCSRCGFIFDRV